MVAKPRPSSTAGSSAQQGTQLEKGAWGEGKLVPNQCLEFSSFIPPAPQAKVCILFSVEFLEAQCLLEILLFLPTRVVLYGEDATCDGGE